MDYYNRVSAFFFYFVHSQKVYQNISHKRQPNIMSIYMNIFLEEVWNTIRKLPNSKVQNDQTYF